MRRDGPGALDGAPVGRIFGQRPVRPGFIVIIEVGREHSAQMGIVDHDHVVQTFPTYSSDDALSMAVLPWRSKAGWSVPNTHRTNAPLEDATELHIVVSN